MTTPTDNSHKVVMKVTVYVFPSIVNVHSFKLSSIPLYQFFLRKEIGEHCNSIWDSVVLEAPNNNVQPLH